MYLTQLTATLITAKHCRFEHICLPTIKLAEDVGAGEQSAGAYKQPDEENNCC